MKINRLECVERTVRASHDGTEIIRTFFVDPYEAHQQVLSVLLGFIYADDNGALHRHKPAHDSYFANCYCTEAWVDQTAKEAMASSPALAQDHANLIDLDGSESLDDILDQSQQKEVPSGPSMTLPGGVKQNAGCIIRAIYKPLIFLTVEWSQGTVGFTPDPFDFVDPLFQPIIKTVSCGAGLKYTVNAKNILGMDAPWYNPVGSEGFCVQPMQQFTIRRIMCPKVPSQTIGKLEGKINGTEFELGGFVFPAETLRFDNCEVTKRAVPSWDGTLTAWYDLLYTFTWNTIYEEHWINLANGGGQFYGPSWVGWNRIFGCPTTPLTGVVVQLKGYVTGGEDREFPLSYYPVGWKSEVFGEYHPLYTHAKKTDPHGHGGTDHGFADLFNPDSP